ncbi:MAG: GAF domain-containing sensor histidine kinase [Leptolyngbyaceae cyanobacterium SM1_4_3]|nr:GAF domain-containing sensor histidine kinase [Leptolyngbyaceae cyanobacterium SM1_4_3]
MVSNSSQAIRACNGSPSPESIIEAIVRDTAASTGQNFFESLVRSLALALDVRHCLLTKLLENGQLQTLAFWRDGRSAPSITYDPTPGPCGVVLSQDLYYCASGVQQLFPHQPALPLLEAESYVGVSLRSHQGKILGNLAVLDSRPILERKLHEDLLQLFAARASAELERQQAIDALQMLNTELEVWVKRRTVELARQTEDLQQALFELKQAQLSLIQNEKMSALGRLVGGVAHEINNPITFIKGNLAHASQYTQALFKLVNLYRHHCPKPSPEIIAELNSVDLDYLAEDLPKLFTSMEVGAERVEKIVRSLRTFSRLDEAEYKAIDLHENLDSILLLLQDKLYRKASASDIQIIKQYGNVPLVECYPGQLNQVFMNLLCNAIEALHSSNDQPVNQNMVGTQGEIRVTTELVHSDQVAIRIADNGSGISDEMRRHIFDPFFTTKPVGQGTGLGLSMCYQIVTKKHRGRLELYSSLGQGSEFVVCIPLSQEMSK